LTVRTVCLANELIKCAISSWIKGRNKQLKMSGLSIICLFLVCEMKPKVLIFNFMILNKLKRSFS
ncbi:MAG: hypothetical protein L0I60_03215, partial [Enterobacterales bacterium]|nr:hypothetical protein [Enterobacterales bacterium]